jgi:hypothetical protein
MSWDDGDFYDVAFAIHRSRRYHAKMRAFYQTFHDYTTAATAISGASGFVAIVADAAVIAKVLTAIVAIASSLDLVFGFDKKAALHDGLCRRFTDLAARLEEWDQTIENLRRAKEARLEIEKDEPSEKRLIDLIAQNEESRSRGVSTDKLVKLTWWQRRFGYLFTFGMKEIEAQYSSNK